MDDTKGLKKSIFDSIFAQIEYISSNEWGRKVTKSKLNVNIQSHQNFS